MLPDEVREAVESTDDEFEVMLEGLSPLNRAEHIERTSFQMDRLHWQTIRAHLLAREAEVERLQDSVNALGLQGAEFMDRCERAEALLRECHARLSTYHPADRRLANRITTHLSENSRG